MTTLANPLRKGARLALPLFLFLFVGIRTLGWGVRPVWASPLAQDQGPNQAGLVVVHGDGRVVTRCVSFEEPEVTGLALLQRSGLAFLTESGPMGSTICSLDGEGCPSSDCFCECKGTPCAYWNYFHRQPDGTWTYSGMGAAVWMIGDGDVDAWVWGDGSQAPAATSFDAICGGAPVEAPPATQSPDAGPTPVPTSTPTPTPTATPTSTAASKPTAAATSVAPESTVSPTVTPSATPTLTPEAPHTSEPTATEAAAPTVTTTPGFQTPENQTPEDQTAADEAQSGLPSAYLAFLALLAIVVLV
ncbi:MAG: hypothetical protein ACP5JG_01510, partial [Anaerolineae bacterium]